MDIDNVIHFLIECPATKSLLLNLVFSLFIHKLLILASEKARILCVQQPVTPTGHLNTETKYQL